MKPFQPQHLTLAMNVRYFRGLPETVFFMVLVFLGGTVFVQAQQPIPGEEKAGLQRTQAEWDALIQRVEQLETAQKKDKEKSKSKPSVKLGGRIQMDTGSFDQNDVSKFMMGDWGNGSEIRRARLNASGSFMEQVNYKAEVDFAGNAVSLKDTYIEVVKLPFISGVKAGYYKESYSLDCLTSSNYGWFIERSTPNNAITQHVGERSLGVSIGNWSEKDNYLWNLGGYEAKGVKTSDDRDGCDFVARFAFLPWENPSDGSFLHLGASYVYKNRNESTALKYDAKPEYGLAKTSISSGNIADVSAINAVGLELIYAWGSLAIQSELYYEFLNDAHSSTVSGGYVQAGYWLTGEYYNYAKGYGTLSRNTVCAPFFRYCKDSALARGPGAWQLTYRFSWLDLSDFNYAMAGKIYDHTFGVNWHLNDHTRVMLNYILSNSEYSFGDAAGKTGLISVCAASFQIHF